MNDQLERALDAMAARGADPGAQAVWERAAEGGHQRRRRRQLRTTLVSAVVIVIAIAGIATAVDRHGAAPQRIIVDAPPRPPAVLSKDAIAFTRDDTVWTMEPSGADVRAITRHGCCSGSAWSPDHREIAIGNDDAQLTIVTATGKVVRRFGATTIFQPSWKPDGSQIAFAASPAGSSNGGPIEVVDANGKHAPRVVAKVFAGTVAWSPDGKQIAFTNLDEPIHIDVLTLATGKVHRLTNGPGNEQWDPNWSPVTGRIAFASNRGLYEIAADGTGLRRIVNADQPCCWLSNPTWSPDGKQIVFTQVVQGTVEDVDQLFVADVSTHRVRQLTSGSPGTLFPAW